MRAITKGAEPRSLTEHRALSHAGYENFSDKQDLRQALVLEQRGLCCYCMGRIWADSNKMKIEHWRCQSTYSHLELDFRNLLGACPGGNGQPLQLQHCDTRKGDHDLKWNPAEPSHQIERRLRYEPDGSIHAEDPEFNQQISQVLNLNMPWLKNNRKAVWTAVLQWWRMTRPNITRLQHEILKRTGGSGDLQPYCQVAAWSLSLKLAKLERNKK